MDLNSLFQNLFPAILGIFFGSFINTLIDRTPEYTSIIFSRSQCDLCNKKLSATELIPIISYFVLKGKCKTCKGKINQRQPIVEVITGIITILIFQNHNFNFTLIPIITSTYILIVISAIDLEHKIIPNRLIIPSNFIGILMSPFWNVLSTPKTFPGLSGVFAPLINSTFSGIGSLALPLIIFLKYPKGMGGGDWKLACFTGIILGFPSILLSWWITSITGGLVAIYLLTIKKKSLKYEIPYAIFISFGALLILIFGDSAFNTIRYII
ncbi:MAG: hypothetical protein FI687_02395 [SAR202 cluster bacterium]|nr:hypothetical protein [SAR202 cluster bacterium]